MPPPPAHVKKSRWVQSMCPRPAPRPRGRVAVSVVPSTPVCSRSGSGEAPTWGLSLGPPFLCGKAEARIPFAGGKRLKRWRNRPVYGL